MVVLLLIPTAAGPSHRSEKLNASYPDFKHKKKTEALWLTDRLRPPWVKAELAALAPGAVKLSSFSQNLKLARLVQSQKYEKPVKLKKSVDAHNSGFLSEDPDSSEGRSRYSQQDLETERTAETPAKLKGRPSGLRNGDAPQKSRSEKQGEDPYRVLENGQKVYLDELDVITLLEPPPFLRPLPSVYYNHAAFLWKKIGDIPEERRHRLLDLLLPRHVTKMWELSRLRYEDPGAFIETAADMLPKPDSPDPVKPMVWDGRVIQVPWYLTGFSRFQKVFFLGADSKTYGRVITGGNFLSKISDRLSPLYFEVMHADSVMATEEPCDLVLEYGNGHLHLRDTVPPGFPRPSKHLPPFNDKACDYLRAVGPGVMVGQLWVEGRRLDQFPRRLFGEFIMVRRFQ